MNRKPPSGRSPHPPTGKMAVSILLAVLAAVLSLAPVVVLVELARCVLPMIHGNPVNAARLWWLLSALVVASVLQELAVFRSYQVSHRADGVLAENLRQKQITTLSRLPLSWFTRTPSGAVKTYVEDDVSKIHQLIAHGHVESVGTHEHLLTSSPRYRNFWGEKNEANNWKL